MSYDTNRTNVSLSQIGVRAPNTAPAVGSIIYVPAAGGGWDELVISVPGTSVLRNALVVDNGDTAPSYKATLDATNPADIDAAASPGTSLIYPHRDHVHRQDQALLAVDFLVGTATGELSGEIVAGTTPGGELGGTWDTPTVDTTHSGSAHHDSLTIGADGEHSLAIQVLSGVDASTSQKGHASFNSSHFSISSGAVSLLTPVSGVRSSSDQEVTDTTLTDSTQLTLTLDASSEYEFSMYIFFLNDGATEGFKAALSGTVGVSAIIAQISIYDDNLNSLVGFARVTATGSSVGAGLSSGSNYAEIKGSILTTTTGTFLVQFAQNATGASAGVHIEVGSTFRVVKVS